MVATDGMKLTLGDTTPIYATPGRTAGTITISALRKGQRHSAFFEAVPSIRLYSATAKHMNQMLWKTHTFIFRRCK